MLVWATNPLFLNFMFLPFCCCQLEEQCSGETLDIAEQEELSESQRKPLSAILDQPSSGSNTNDSHSTNAAHLNAAHLLVSAMEGKRKLWSWGTANIFPSVLLATPAGPIPIIFYAFILLCVYCSCRVAWWNSEPPEWEQCWFSGGLQHTG